MSEFNVQIAMITGASGNLGKAVAERFLRGGAKLILIDHAIGRLNSNFPHLNGSKNYLLAGGVDVTDPTMMQKVTQTALEHYGRLDILVNTVGAWQPGLPLHQTSLEAWDTMHHINVRSTIVACRAVIPCMLVQKYGKIINVSSRAGLNGSAGGSVYSAAKSEVIRITESLDAELKNDGINVNCVLPGTIDTPRNRQGSPNADFTRWVRPESLAEVIFFLASDAAQDIHAAAIPVYGRS